MFKQNVSHYLKRDPDWTTHDNPTDGLVTRRRGQRSIIHVKAPIIGQNVDRGDKLC